MPAPLPQTTADWLHEVLEHLEMAALAAAAEGLDSAPERSLWVTFMQRQALALACVARGLQDASDDPERLLVQLDAVDDLARLLRGAVPGRIGDVLSEGQLFLLLWLAVHVHARLLPVDRAKALVQACWKDCTNAPDDGAAPERADDADDQDADDGEDDEPWPITVPAPRDATAWLGEITAAYARRGDAPALPVCDGAAFAPDSASLLEIATAIALANRGVCPPGGAVHELIDTIGAMEEDVRSQGPEWEAMQSIPALAFSMYYVWVHLAMGVADEDQAMLVMRECSSHLADFPESERQASTRPQRRNGGR